MTRLFWSTVSGTIIRLSKIPVLLCLGVNIFQAWLREATNKSYSLNGRAIKRGGGGFIEKKNFFGTFFSNFPTFQRPSNSKGGGGKALMTRPLRQDIFFAASLRGVRKNMIGTLCLASFLIFNFLSYYFIVKTNKLLYNIFNRSLKQTYIHFPCAIFVKGIRSFVRLVPVFTSFLLLSNSFFLNFIFCTVFSMRNRKRKTTKINLE